MPTYAIGDVQGCFDELEALLKRIGFSPGTDRLLFCGDLINRGPKSLQVLRFVRSLGNSAVTVLGNHDLHLLAVAAGGKPGRRDTLTSILAAPDRDSLTDWLAEQPLAYRESRSGTLMVHAGLAPQWSGEQALQYAAEVSAALRQSDGSDRRRSRFLSEMYGDKPALWSDRLRGIERLRMIVNSFTRLRYCRPDGSLDMHSKGKPGAQPASLMPWFAVPDRKSGDENIVFGHWSTLGKIHWPEYRVHGLDTGCVWGGELTALRLHDGVTFSVPSEGYSDIN